MLFFKHSLEIDGSFLGLGENESVGHIQSEGDRNASDQSPNYDGIDALADAGV
jgi:hypothetical protein